MKVAIVGSRDYPLLAQVRDYVRTLPLHVEVVSGGARGVDRTAVEVAEFLGLDTHTFNADWDGLGRGAGLARNSKIVQYADIVVAFWDLRSRGTLDTIRKALRAKKPVWIYTPEDAPFEVLTKHGSN